MLLAMAERRLGLADKLARVFPDRRDPKRVVHSLVEMFRSRMFAICCGYEDADGMMILSGRTSEIINAGGLKLAPEVVEEMLRAHPAVADAAAFGTMGEGGTEEVLVAVVVRTPVAERQLIDWSAERGIPVARVFIVDTLPKTPSGKIHRDQLKRQLLT
jgi:acyl-coenzyme A synthetase/AMP-(fatty) acid ligase